MKVLFVPGHLVTIRQSRGAGGKRNPFFGPHATAMCQWVSEHWREYDVIYLLGGREDPQLDVTIAEAYFDCLTQRRQVDSRVLLMGPTLFSNAPPRDSGEEGVLVQKITEVRKGWGSERPDECTFVCFSEWASRVKDIHAKLNLQLHYVILPALDLKMLALQTGLYWYGRITDDPLGTHPMFGLPLRLMRKQRMRVEDKRYQPLIP